MLRIVKTIRNGGILNRIHSFLVTTLFSWYILILMLKYSEERTTNTTDISADEPRIALRPLSLYTACLEKVRRRPKSIPISAAYKKIHITNKVLA